MRTCRACGRALDEAEFATPLRVKCKACELYESTLANTKGKGAPLEMTREEMLDAFGASGHRRCYYCGISEPAYVRLAVKTPSGKPGLRLGLDRKDTALPYRAGNVVVCCLVCNRLKSSTFTHDEMVELGQSVMQIWRRRGLDAEPVR
jgi:hypothetical protein